MLNLLCLGESLWCYFYLVQTWAEYSPRYKTRSYCPKEPAAINPEMQKGCTMTPMEEIHQFLTKQNYIAIWISQGDERISMNRDKWCAWNEKEGHYSSSGTAERTKKKKRKDRIINSNMLGKATRKTARVSCSVSIQLLIYSNHSHFMNNQVLRTMTFWCFSLLLLITFTAFHILCHWYHTIEFSCLIHLSGDEFNEQTESILKHKPTWKEYASILLSRELKSFWIRRPQQY